MSTSGRRHPVNDPLTGWRRGQLDRERIARAILGVDEGADPDALKRAYRRLAHDHHPDKRVDDPAAHDRFTAVTNAYLVLLKGVDLPLMPELFDLIPADPRETRSGYFDWWKRRFGR